MVVKTFSRTKFKHYARMTIFALGRIRPLIVAVHVVLATIKKVLLPRLSRPSLVLRKGEVKFRSQKNTLTFHYPAELPLGYLMQIFREKIFRPAVTFKNSKMTIIDCGAHIGISTLWLREEYSSATIYAFEPSNENYRYLVNNLEAQNDISAVNAGVWSKTTSLELYLSEKDGVSHSLFQNMSTCTTVERVNVVRLDEFCASRNIPNIDLLKLNIEGSELEALKGLGERIKDVKVVIGDLHVTLEVSFEAKFIDFLISRDFEVTTTGEGEHKAFTALNRSWTVKNETREIL
jgi:FkbM family methyltransferase